MTKNTLILLAFLLLFSMPAAFAVEDYDINFTPEYPVKADAVVLIKLKTDLPAVKVTVVFENEDQVPLIKKGDLWLGKYILPKNIKPGWHQVNVYFKQQFPEEPNLWEKFLSFFRIKTESRYKSKLERRSVNVRAAKKEEIGKLKKELSEEPLLYLPPYPESFKYRVTTEAESIAILEEEDIVETRPSSVLQTSAGRHGVSASKEAYPLIIKGSHVTSFTSKNVEGSREGFTSGSQREDTLRLNIKGTIDGTEIDANIFKNPSIGTTQTATSEEKYSILLKRGSTEAYMGDFTADLNETEFTSLNQVLQGVRLKGDYKNAGFKILASTPQGTPKTKRFYGNGTQGPYTLDSAPAVVDSEKVYLDGVLQKRGDDYTVDYNAGTITFRTKTIISTSIIQVNYDFRQTVFQHSLYALRGYVKPTDKIKVGATYINDSDSTQNAESIQAATGKNPAGHQVFGIDSSLILGDSLSLDSEFAISEKNWNLLSPGSMESGTALKTNAAGNWGPFGLKTNYKKINPGFETAATALSKKNLLDYGGILSFNPNSLFNCQTNYNSQSYKENDIPYEIIDHGFLSRLNPSGLPNLEYGLSENEDSTDPVLGTTIRRITTKNSLASNYQNFLGLWNLSAKGQKERRLNRYPTEEVTTYDTAQLGVSTSSKLEKITASANLEYKKTTEPLGNAYSTKTYDLKFSATPNSSYNAAASINFIDDAKLGKTNVTDLSYKAAPIDKISSDGKLSITSVKETFGSTSIEERVTKQTGSFKLDLRPDKPLRLRYYYKPNFTILDRSGAKIYNDENRQMDLDWNFSQQALIAYTYKTQDNFAIDKSDYPSLSRMNTTLKGNSNLYTLKAAPLQFMSAEFNIITDNSVGTTLTSTGSAVAVYQTNNSKAIEYNTTVRTSLSQAFAIDSSYSHKTTLKGTEESFDNAANTIAQTGSLKGIWNPNPVWTFSLSGAASLSRNLLLGTHTYSLSPGAGFIYRLENLLRIDGDYLYSKSFSASKSEVHKFTLNAKYNISQYVNVSLRYQRETSTEPYYRSTDIAGIVEINL